MMIRIYKPLLFVLLAVLAIGCKDDDAPAGDSIKPLITIINPVNGAVINLPGDVSVAGTIEEAGELESIKVTIQADSPLPPYERIVKKGDPNFPTKSDNVYAINVTEFINIEPGQRTPVTITVNATDAAGNVGTSVVNVFVE